MVQFDQNIEQSEAHLDYRRVRADLSEPWNGSSSHDRGYGETDADEPNPTPMVLLADFGRDEPELRRRYIANPIERNAASLIAVCLAAYCFSNT